MEERGGTKSQTCSQVAVSSLPALSLRTPLAYTDRFPSCLEPFGRGMFWSRGSGSHPAPPALWQQNKAIPSPSGSWPWAASGPWALAPQALAQPQIAASGPALCTTSPPRAHQALLLFPSKLMLPEAPTSQATSSVRGGDRNKPKKKRKKKKGLSCNVISRPAPH